MIQNRKSILQKASHFGFGLFHLTKILKTPVQFNPTYYSQLAFCAFVGKSVLKFFDLLPQQFAQFFDS